ncbi:MAG: hypothetical protein JXR10_15045 [Cyclobacteriaceae bacterium]
MEKAKAFHISTKKGHKIAATLHSKESKNPHLIIVSSAAGVLQKYYRFFATYACDNSDFDVVTFDYSGIGGSATNGNVNINSTMSEWGANDLAAVIEWADSKYDKICLLGHSVAGQIFPKATNNKRIIAAYFVAAQTPYHGFWKGFNKLKVWFLWYFALPLSVLIFGHLPGWILGGKVNFPSKAAWEWRKWATTSDGVIQGNLFIERQFSSVKIPLHFVTIGDDEMMAPSAATQALMSYYKNAKTTFQYIEPKNLSLEEIGHFGFFRKNMAKTLWPMPIFFFKQYVNKFE